MHFPHPVLGLVTATVIALYPLGAARGATIPEPMSGGLKNFEASFHLDQDFEISLSDKVAEIYSQGGKLATCEARHFERDESNAPIALEMNCRGAGLSALTTTAVLTWTLPEGTTKIRLGTWLQGYQEATLQVRVDRFMGSRTIAKRQ